LFRRDAKELAHLASVDPDAKEGFDAQGLPSCSQQAIERVGARRQNTQLDTSDCRLRDSGKPAQLALRHARATPSSPEESRRCHDVRILDSKSAIKFADADMQ